MRRVAALVHRFRTPRSVPCVARVRGFTLVEMLVVLGIVLMMVGLLMPALTKARKAAATTKCLAQMRELGIAVGQYLNENANFLPDAVASDSPDDIGGLPAIDVVLGKYFARDYRVWKCPNQVAAKRYDPFSVRSGEFHAPGFTDSAGFASEARFVPGYLYLGTKDYHLFIEAGKNGNKPAVDPAKYHLAAWVVRNVAGVKIAATRTVDSAPASNVCLFIEYSSTFHSQTAEDVYDVDLRAQRGNFQENFLYLDGHAETRRFSDFESLLDQVHQGIRQSAFGVDFYQQYREAYDEK